jgi:excisionase family DNA binding protein
MPAIIDRSLRSCQHNVSEATHRSVPFQERLTCTVAQACEAVGIGPTKLYELIANGDLKSLNVGRRRLIRVDSILKFLSIEA